MNRQQAINYLLSSGFSEEQINIIEQAFKQEPTTKNDLALIHTEGLDEEIRCTMCTNSMKSDRGCDGSCVVNKDMYKAVMDAIEKRIQPSVTPQEPKCKDCKWWKDSDGEYRRGCGAESQCPINRKKVFEGNGYCYLFEPQESEE